MVVLEETRAAPKKPMDKIPAVEAAKALMSEAVAWSVMKWLREKKTVRRAADQANAALDQMEQSIKNRWPEAITGAYKAFFAEAAAKGAARGQPKPATANIDPHATLIARKVKEADDDARRARIDAEETFDAAEKQLSTALAREGCRKAIHSWELHEKAIRKAAAILVP